MYSKIQQQCLNELGIQAFELKPEFSSADTNTANQDNISNDSPSFQSTASQAEDLKQSVSLEQNPEKNVQTTQESNVQTKQVSSVQDNEPRIEIPVSWQLTPSSLIDDLSGLLTGFSVSADRATFTSGNDKIEWQQLHSAILPSIKDQVITTKQLVNLSVQDKREIWQVLQPLCESLNQPAS